MTQTSRDFDTFRLSQVPPSSGSVPCCRKAYTTKSELFVSRIFPSKDLATLYQRPPSRSV
ncbi:unnamed protein product [Gulo gulo]|uniref:Uncharacterized protein n=1 Tax=Gulo gulo TaxID=48420 RepID=A0A9X9M6G2_GULGU|nr:unnamed protein product [Gulo gulo]